MPAEKGGVVSPFDGALPLTDTGPVASPRRPRTPTAPKPKRGVRLQGKALHDAVTAACLVEFQERIGKPWDRKHKRVLARIPDHSLEKRAREMHAELRKLFRRAAALTEEIQEEPRKAWADKVTAKHRGRASVWLASWVPEHISQLLRQATFGGPDDWGPLRDDLRTRLVDTLERYNHFGLPHGTWLSARSYSLIALLCGSWPTVIKGREYSVPELIRLEQKAMEKPLERYGVKPMWFAVHGSPGRDPKRKPGDKLEVIRQGQPDEQRVLMRPSPIKRI